MRFYKLLLTAMLTIGMLGSGTNLFAHGSGSGTGSGNAMGDFMVTRHFTGTWDQVDQESQGLSLEVIEQLDGSRKAVVYWFTYGADRKTAWFLGIGILIDDRIEFTLFDSIDVGFMQVADPGFNPVKSIGTMIIVFDGCNSGVVTFETDHAEVGNGSFSIERISAVMNTHCSGGISDDMHADAMFGEQLMELIPAREGITGNGHARYEDFPGHMEFEVEVEGLPDGDYRLFVGMEDRGVINVHEGHGKAEFTSPGETGTNMMTFDPRGMRIEIHDDQGVVLSSFDGVFEQDEHDHHGEGDGHNNHNYDCEFGPGSGHGHGHGPGGGMMNCVDDGEFVEIEDVPLGSYPLRVGGIEVGIIEAYEMHNGEIYGHIAFRDPEVHSREYLVFDPRGQKIEVFQGDTIILEIEFPVE
jgi:hypothetical protein